MLVLRTSCCVVSGGAHATAAEVVMSSAEVASLEIVDSAAVILGTHWPDGN